MSEKKNKLVDIATIVGICGTILIIIFILVVKLYSSNPERKFSLKCLNVYNNIIKIYKNDKESGIFYGKDFESYSSQSVFKSGEVINYVVKFNIKEDSIIYFCANDGTRKIEINDEVTNEQIKNIDLVKLDNKPCEIEGE